MRRTNAHGILTGCALTLAMTGLLATAGEPVMEPAPAPAPEPSLWQWFVGGSGGYLFDAENEIWTAHIWAWT